VVGQDKRGAIMLRQKWSRGQLETRLANLRPCLIGMEACVGAHHLSRKLRMCASAGGRFMPPLVGRRTLLLQARFWANEPQDLGPMLVPPR
jgi:hypothetical protein